MTAPNAKSKLLNTALTQVRRAGYDVTGVFIKIWQPEFTECTWREDRLDAMRVAAYLKIPFREIDLSDEYNEEVVKEMIAAYRSGITPNPDVVCNEKIKFGHFLRWALENGAEYVATGHYAQCTLAENSNSYRLHRGADPDKDQSYFLYRLGQHELSHALFPVGGFKKSRVRTLAREFGLPVAQKGDSQGLCFVGPVSIPEFLSRYIPLNTGEVRDAHGEVIGEHGGAALFTIGQRHGFRLKSASSTPLYVVAIDIATNTITVAENALDAAVTSIELSNMHWIHDAHDTDRLLVQTRYREVAVPARVLGTTLRFSEPHIVSPGQSVVLYCADTDSGECYGGGIAARIHTHR